MGIALSLVHGLFEPLNELLDWFLSPINAPRKSVAAAAPAMMPRAAPPCVRRVHRPLRVVRVMDKDGVRQTGSGRMVISGRMADVCAELDRLAALESGSC